MVLSKQKNAGKNQETSDAAPGENVHVGELLRQGRETHGLTLDMVADELMIRRFYLDALEAGSFKDLPERVYALGFVKNYAKYLGMDHIALGEQFKKEAYGTRSTGSYQIDLNMPEPVAHSVVPGRSALLSAVVVLALLIAGVVFMTRGSDKNDAATIPAPDLTSDATPAVATPVVDAASSPPTASEPALFAGAQTDNATPSTGNAPAAMPPPARPVPPGQPRRVLEALQSSWVEVKDDKGTILFTSILKAGQLLPLPEGKRMMVTTGNAGGLRLVLDGQAQSAFGPVNEVKRNIPIAPAPETVPNTAAR